MIDNWSVHNQHHQFLVPSTSSGSSSPRSSRLSVLTSASSVSSSLSDVQVPSPLPSPAFSVTSSTSKTHAFFGSPFADGSPTPLPPPNPPTRSSSLKSDTSIHSRLSSDETPRVDTHPVPRSLNADFFGTSPPQYRPTPPPSIRSFETASSHSPDNSPPASPPPPPKKTILPPLSRFFPYRSRFSTIDALPSREPSRCTNREFLNVDATAPPNSYHPSTGSRTSSSERDSRSSAELPSTPPTPDLRPIPGPSSLSLSPPKHPLIHPTTPQPAPPDQPQLPHPFTSGDIIGDSSLSLELIRTLGQGAFSSVWLAKDVHSQLPALELSRRSSLVRSRSRKKNRSKRIEGTLPKGRVATQAKEGIGLGLGLTQADRTDSDLSVYLSSAGPGRPEKKMENPPAAARLVAVKMTDRTFCDKNDRSRVSFIREVEVLRHISHPSIVSYLHSFSTPSHHCLVLEHVSGGELFDLIDSPESHAKLNEPLLRRMFGELCKAVGWMHAVGLVHRDIKLENILLTSHPFNAPLPALPAPLVKLTDFGLSRFIDPAQPLLTTRCGSESYAAPELVTGRSYDGRETDSWACGVVLYALATRRLPFDKPSQQRQREERVGVVPDNTSPSSRRGAGGGGSQLERIERKALLIRIAKGEYAWPDLSSSTTAPAQDASTGLDNDQCGAFRNGGGHHQSSVTLTGERLSTSSGVRNVVGKLLVRDPRKRSKMMDLWEDPWMKGEGAPPPPVISPADYVEGHDAVTKDEDESDSRWSAEADEDACGDNLDEDGLLVDEQEIGPGHVARQEHY